MVKYTYRKNYCHICEHQSKQKSHHDKHLGTEKHLDKTELTLLKIKDKTEKFYLKNYGYNTLEKVMDMLIGKEPKYELILQQKTNKVIFELNEKDLEENKNHESFKNKLKSKLKSWHNTLSGNGVTGDPALDDIMSMIMICYLHKHISDKGQFDLLNRKYYPELDDEEFIEYTSLLNINTLLKSSCNLCRSNKEDGFSKIEKIGEILRLHPITGKIINENNFINCKKDKILYKLLKDCLEFCNEYNIFKYPDIIGIVYEFMMNEYKGGGGKQMGSFFTERQLMRMCFELIDKEDIEYFKINNDSTIGDEFCGTFGFPLYFKQFLKEKFSIKIKNKNIYGIEFEKRLGRMAIMNAMFSLDNIENVKCADSFITNVSPHLDISVHNVPFGKRIKYKDTKEHYEEYKLCHLDIPEFDEIIKSKANLDATLASQMVIYKTKHIGLCIIKDGQEATGTNKELITYRKNFCDSVNIKKILKIPSGAFSSTGTKTLCLYFIKDGNKTENIQFLELSDSGNTITELCNVSYEDLEHNNYLWSPNTYLLDEELLKLKKNSKCEWKKLGDICEFKRGERITKKDHIENGKYYVIGGGDETNNFKINKFNRKGFNCRIARYGGSEKNFIKTTNYDYWLHDNAFTIHMKNELVDIKYVSYYLLNNIKNNYYYKKLNNSVPPALDFDGFKNIKIPIPSIEKQKEAIEMIDTLKNLIESMEIQNEKHKNIMKIYINTMIKKYIDDIKFEKLGDICEIKNGKSITKNKLVEGPYPVIGGGTKPLGYHNKKNVKSNTILISKDGANAGYISKYNTDIFASGHCLYIDSVKEEVTEDYLYFFLKNQEKSLYKLQKGAGQPGINKEDLNNNIKILVPTIEKQNEIVNYLDSINNVIKINEDKIVKYKELIKEILCQSYE